MVRRIDDLTGRRFGRLIVVERAESQRAGQIRWSCLCDCGSTTVVRSSHLKDGGVKSCGCLRRENHSNMKHGFSKSRLWRIWRGMKDRCYRETNASFKDYGARGITVCDEWIDDFHAFMRWALSNGYQDSLTIERVNNEGNYEPSNCRWASKKEQARNRRTNHVFNGKTLAEWSEITGINKRTLSTRINILHWPIEMAVSEQTRRYKKSVSRN